MYEYAKNLTKDGQTGLAIDWGNNMAVKAYDACVMGANGNLYESDGNTLNFTAGPVKNMLQVWQDLVKDGYTTTDVFADADANRTNFKAGRVAMHIAPASRWIEAGSFLGQRMVGVMPIGRAQIPMVLFPTYMAPLFPRHLKTRSWPLNSSRISFCRNSSRLIP